MEDVMLDLLLADEGVEIITSLQDCKKFVTTKLKEWIVTDNETVTNALSDKLSIKISAYKTSKTIPEGTELSKLIKSVKKLNVEKEMLVLYTNIEGTPELSVAIPDIASTDIESLKALTSLLELACLVHGVKIENLKVNKNPKIEKKIAMSSSFWKTVDALKASAKSMSGDFKGPRVVFQGSKYTAYPPNVLASMRILQNKDHLIRKHVFRPGSGRSVVTFHDLQQKFNETLGIKSEDSALYAVRLLKGMLASCVKAYNKGFPGGWIYSNRLINKVKTDSGILSLLGWQEKIPSQHKLLDVIFNPIDRTYSEKDANGQKEVIMRKMVNISQKGRNTSFQEFRTAVFLSAEKIDLENSDEFEKALKTEPLEFKDPSVADRYTTVRSSTMVDALNKAYAFKIDFVKPKSKTLIEHYDNARGQLLSLSANQKIIDRKGKEYSTFSELPKNAQEFFRKKYRYPVKQNKRSAESQSVHTEQVEVIASTSMEVDAPAPPQKRRKAMSKGQAAEARKTLDRKAKKSA